LARAWGVIMDYIRVIQAAVFGVVILIPLYLKLRGIHKQMNSRLDELIKAVRLSAFGEGQERERSDQRERDARRER
jgi:hypothetical protein